MQPWYLQHIEIAPLLLGFVVSLLGVVVLFVAWRQRQRKPMLLAVGWGLLVLSYRYWARAAGLDSGITIGSTAITLVALLFVLGNGEWRKRKSRRAPSDEGGQSALPAAVVVDPLRKRRTLLRTLAAGPLSFLAALSLSMLVVVMPDAPEANRIMFGACVMMVAWPVGMVWSCASSYLRSPLAAFSAVIVVSSAILAVTV